MHVARQWGREGREEQHKIAYIINIKVSRYWELMTLFHRLEFKEEVIK